MPFFLNLFTASTWENFLAQGANVSGFREAHRPRAKRLNTGDQLLVYLGGGVSRWVAVLEVAGEAYTDPDMQTSPSVLEFPVRVPVKVTVRVKMDEGLPMRNMLSTLDKTRHMENMRSWGVHFASSLTRWSDHDGSIIKSALSQRAQATTSEV